MYNANAQVQAKGGESTTLRIFQTYLFMPTQQVFGSLILYLLLINWFPSPYQICMATDKYVENHKTL